MRVPADRVLGQVGKGLKVALGVLDYGRCTLSAGCVGGAKLALELSMRAGHDRAPVRPAAIGEFHLVKEKIAPHGRDHLRDGGADVSRRRPGRPPRAGT